MKRLAAFLAALILSGGAYCAPLIVEAESGAINSDRTEVIADARYSGGQGVALQIHAPSYVEATRTTAPDIVLKIKLPSPGLYEIRSWAGADKNGAAELQRATTVRGSKFMRLQIDSGIPTKRVVMVPWLPPELHMQEAGIFEFRSTEAELKIWLPRHVRLDRLQISPWQPPAVPEKCQSYVPPIEVPPHPRLWVNSAVLPGIKAALDAPSHAPLWQKVLESAQTPYQFNPPSNAELEYNPELQTAAINKAFVYLMTGNERCGREAVELMVEYLELVEFGNLLDISRSIGRAISAGAMVYDWCYPLMTGAERDGMRRNMLRLARSMEIGYPPFKQPIVNGHGNEAQVNCDLLSMAIAVYDEDPEPFKYCAYLELETLFPMRAIEYKSSRHNQGLNYASFRLNWELHAAWLFYRLTGEKLFPAEVETLLDYVHYMRAPSGSMLPDGDGHGYPAYWSPRDLTFMLYTYSGDPKSKGEFIRQGGAAADPVMFLLLDDPALVADMDLSDLPLTRFFPGVLGSMSARTGWNIGRDSDDILVAMKGAGKMFGNHQHSDYGSFQIYFRGALAGDLGQYAFYGTPYDHGFNKRSVAHSMLLVYDPEEKFDYSPINDGGQRYVQNQPLTVEQMLFEPQFDFGRVLCASWGPDKTAPDFSYMSSDLTPAYSGKVSYHRREFCFINLKSGNDAIKGLLLVFDRVNTPDPAHRKIWQVNSFKKPEISADGVRIYSDAPGGRSGKLFVQPLIPQMKELDLAAVGGDGNSIDVFGQKLVSPHPNQAEAQGYRNQFSPKEASGDTTFLFALQIGDKAAAELPVSTRLWENGVIVEFPGWLIFFNKSRTPLSGDLRLNVPASGTRVLLTGVQPGEWIAYFGNNRAETGVAASDEGTLFFTAPLAGEVQLYLE